MTLLQKIVFVVRGTLVLWGFLALQGFKRTPNIKKTQRLHQCVFSTLAGGGDKYAASH